MRHQRCGPLGRDKYRACFLIAGCSRGSMGQVKNSKIVGLSHKKPLMQCVRARSGSRIRCTS